MKTSSPRKLAIRKKATTGALGLMMGTMALATLPSLAMADQTAIRTMTGTVNNVEILTSTYIRKTPVSERVCKIEDVPIYGQNQNSGEDTELGSMIIGGLIGSAVGNQLTDADGAGTFGAVTGAILGREHNKNKQKSSNIVGYRQEEVCTIEKSTREERVEEVTGYRLTIDVNDEVVTLKSSQRYDVGDLINIRTRTTYSLN
ncbi:MAG: hypothetical protein EBU10_06475 [Alphaproteobacteria bacterium]|jgi:uncharacterized protein YcfJ|nr:hypothetical protein [Alphaproteobacteria bacterium]